MNARHTNHLGGILQGTRPSHALGGIPHGTRSSLALGGIPQGKRPSLSLVALSSLFAGVLAGGCEEAQPLAPPELDRVHSIEISAPRTALEVGEVLQLSGLARNAGGQVLSAAPLTWTSSDTVVAGVSPEGVVSGRAPGRSVLRASAQGRSSEMELTILQAPLPSIAALLPDRVLERSGPLDLVLEGRDFRAESRVLWNGIPLPTNLLSEERLQARIPGSLLLEPMDVLITVENRTGVAGGTVRRSESRAFGIDPRPLAALTLEVAGNHAFPGQVLEVRTVLRNDLGEVVDRPGLLLEPTDRSIVGFDWMGYLRGVAPGVTTLRASLGALHAEMPVSVGPPPTSHLVVEGWPKGIPELFRVSLEDEGVGGEPFQRILAEGTRAMDPALSRDGSTLAFAGVAQDGSVNLWTVRLDGSRLTRLTEDAFRADQPAWSPDGARIAFRTFRRGLPEIWIVQADGSNPRPLLPGLSFIPEEESHHPVWLPGGEDLVFSRTLGGERVLYRVRVGGGASPPVGGEWIRIPGHDLGRPAVVPGEDALAFEARDRTTGEVRVLLASTLDGTLLHPLNPPAPGLRRPALLGGGWIALVGPRNASSGWSGGPASTLHLQELNGMRVALPVPSWIGRIEAVAVR